MSNYYPCHVRMYNTSFRSSEHAYQWRFLKHIGLDELAQDVLQAPNAAAAKEIAARIPSSMHKDWHTVKTNAMRDVLHAKADSNQLFKTSLLESAGYTIIEAVRGDIFWSSGLSPTIAASTKSEYFPGANQLGSVMTLVRDELTKEAILSTKCGLDTFDLKTPSPPPPHQFRDDDVTSCHSASVNPHRMSESDSNTSISVDGSITDSSPASPSIDSYSGTKVTKSRDTTPNKCDDDVTSCHSASVVNPHRMSESDSNTSISVDGSISDSSRASPSVNSYSGTKVTKSRDTTPNKCDNNSMESHKDSSPQPSSSDPPVLHYKQLASIVDSMKKNPTITRKVKPLRPIKKHGNLVQGTIRATGSTPKRKMSPGKAADTDHMDNKVPRSDRHDI